MLQDVSGKGKIEVPYIGLYFIPISEGIQKKYTLPVNTGAYIFSEKISNPIVKNSPAEKAGVKSGDIITKIDNTRIGANLELGQIIAKKKVGDSLIIEVWRDGKKETFKASLESAPGQ